MATKTSEGKQQLNRKAAANVAWLKVSDLEPHPMNSVIYQGCSSASSFDLPGGRPAVTRRFPRREVKQALAGAARPARRAGHDSRRKTLYRTRLLRISPASLRQGSLDSPMPLANLSPASSTTPRPLASSHAPSRHR